MNDFQFSENSEDDEEFYFFDEPNIPAAKLVENKDQEILNLINNTVTKRKSDERDFNKIKLDNNYEINKQTLRVYLQDLYNLVIQIRKKKFKEINEIENKDLEKNLEQDKINFVEEKENQEQNVEEQDNKKSNAEIRHFKKIQEAAYKKIESSLFVEYYKSSNPFYLNLILIENSNDYRVNKYNSLACLIGKAFDKWVSIQDNLDYKITDELKIDAFIVATRHNLLLLDYITRAYQLSSNNKCLLPFLDLKSKNIDHKEKAVLISSLMLHDYYDCEEILIPLLIQDKINIIDKYLSKSVNQQKLFVKILDKMCNKDFLISSYLYRFELKNVKLDKLSRKNIARLATRIVKTYLIDPSQCPNLTNQKYYKNLRYLVIRRYIEKSITYDPWQELIMECLKQAEYLVGAFIEMLADNDDFKEISKWVKKLDLDQSSLSPFIQQKLKSLILEENESDFSDEDDPISNKFYKLKLKQDRIILVESKHDFHKFIENLHDLANKNDLIYVGVDTEWKPTCVMGVNVEEEKKVALLQVATSDHVYLIDMIKLYEILDENDSHVFSQNFLYNKKIIKLGYGFTHDIKMLSHSFINIHDLESFRLTVLDLAYLVDQLKKFNFKLFESVETKSNENNDALVKDKGLSELVRQCLGKPLNKSEQISNWEKRPLRKSQINYAALDAFCLVEIFNFLKNKIDKTSIEFDFDKCVGKKYKHHASTSPKKESDKKTESKQNLGKIEKLPKPEIIQNVINEKPIKTQDLRVICDNMLGGLGKELRRCGVDTLILENEKDHSEVAKIARKENRFAISSGLPFNLIRNQLPEGKCIHAINGNAKEQCSYILKIFNVDIKENDLFSRCSGCNNGSFIIFNRNQIKALWHKKKYENEEDVTKLSNLKIDDYGLESDEDLKQKIDLKTLCLIKAPSPRIDLDSLFESTIKIIDPYYICEGCGHIYWEGPHWQNIRSRFSHVLNKHV